MLANRKITKQVRVRDVPIGGGAPISIQSMLSVPTTDITKCLEQIEALSDAGCDIVRIAIPDEKAIKSFIEIRKNTDMPLVADIHFDYRLALLAIDAGADKVRINPGNIGSFDRVREVANSAKSKNIPIRIGVNAGSLPKDLSNLPIAEAMIRSAEREINFLRDSGFEDIVVSMKSHSPIETIEANIAFSERYDLPLHIGVTEAGLPSVGSIRNAIGIGTLLLYGIGDTIRVSLTGDPIEEVLTAREILRSVGIDRKGIEIVSCPTCGRCKVDIVSIVKEVSKKLPKTEKSLVVAIMGCEVNGPGEAKSADIGIAGGDACFMLFKRGEAISKIPEEKAVALLIEEIVSMCAE